VSRHKARIAIVGAGLIGRAWAIVFARAGCEVAMFDTDASALAGCRKIIGERLADLLEYGLIEEPVAKILARITLAGSLREALAGATLVQENVRETVEAKRAIYAELDALATRETVLASSTSWIPASEFSADLPGRARCLVAHPVNPPYLVPLVELSPAPWTSAGTVTRAKTLYEAVGQTPIVLRKEIRGFALNRVQGAVLNEMQQLHAQGYVSAEDLDKVMKDGLGLRWSFMGPFETIDLNAPGGVLDYAQRYGQTYAQIAREHQPFDWNEGALAAIDRERRAQLPAAELEGRGVWRDRRLMGLIAHKRKAPKE
jgi:L-gulonate 3-dehydrogenase